ncbi:iron-containing alcohol dehydrogenase, partial [Candidatus Arthromitus sp. SFB-1]
LAIEETKRGVFEDKVIKNLFATEYIHHDIKHIKTVGIINDDPTKDYFNVAEPVGIIAGVTPVTNPTSTAMFKAIISIKTRNPIIFAFHPSAQKCSSEAARVVYEAAISAGAPEHCIQWINEPSIEATNLLMNHPEIALILATGGSGMVKSAYSCGKPALGVGPGNVPAYLEKTCNLQRAVSDIIISKTFDNGMICASEQTAVVDEEISKYFEKLMKELNCHLCSEDEIKKLEKYAFPEDKNSCVLNANIVGKSANEIAKEAGFEVPEKTKILIAKIDSIGPNSPLSREKLSPILSYIIVKNSDEGIEKSCQIVEFGGLGHSAAIHSSNEDIIKKFSVKS